MHLHDINNLIQLQDVTVTTSHISDDNVLFLTLKPSHTLQACPCCQSIKSVIRKGIRKKLRQVRHLRCFNYETILLLPMHRLFCKQCDYSFTYQYSFVSGKSRYINDYKQSLSKPLARTTIKHLTTLFKVPYTTAERFIKDYLIKKVPIIQHQALQLAQKTSQFILGLDDFGIRKGHTYNTGFHDLRNGTFLALVLGRTYQTLSENSELLSQLKSLTPYAVVMDLAQSYHKFIAELFPSAIRVADRFHVNRYVTDAVQEVRRRVSQNLSSKSREYLRKNKYLLTRRYDSLNEEEEKRLEKLLTYSKELAEIYAMKEALIDCYDLSNETNSHRRLVK